MATQFGMGATAMGILAGIVGGLTSYLLVTLMRGACEPLVGWLVGSLLRHCWARRNKQIGVCFKMFGGTKTHVVLKCTYMHMFFGLMFGHFLDSF